MRERFAAVYAGMAVGVVCMVFCIGFFWGVPKVHRPGQSINGWSNTKLNAELGEASQVVPCDQMIQGMQPGLTCRIHVNQSQQRIVIVGSP